MWHYSDQVTIMNAAGIVEHDDDIDDGADSHLSRLLHTVLLYNIICLI